MMTKQQLSCTQGAHTNVTRHDEPTLFLLPTDLCFRPTPLILTLYLFLSGAVVIFNSTVSASTVQSSKTKQLFDYAQGQNVSYRY